MLISLPLSSTWQQQAGRYFCPADREIFRRRRRLCAHADGLLYRECLCCALLLHLISSVQEIIEISAQEAHRTETLQRGWRVLIVLYHRGAPLHNATREQSRGVISVSQPHHTDWLCSSLNVEYTYCLIWYVWSLIPICSTDNDPSLT